MQLKSLVMVLALTCLLGAGPAAADGPEADGVTPIGDLRIDVPEFAGYEVEYTSGMGRFFHQVRPTRRDGAPKISVINIIDSGAGVIVDSRGIDSATLRLEYMMSPYFAWGQEYAVAQFGGGGFEWLRIPLGGGEAQRLVAQSGHGTLIDELGFSPTFAAVLPLPEGARFSASVVQPRKDGSVSTTPVEFEVVGRERLELESGLSCDCWVLEQDADGGGPTRYWVSREAPFVLERHRDIGGSREAVTEALSFRTF